MSSLFLLLAMIATASAFSNQQLAFQSNLDKLQVSDQLNLDNPQVPDQFHLDNPQVEEWNMFKKNYGIQIKNAEEDERRMKIYFMNKNIIDNHNRRYELGLESYKLKINRFSSMAHQEYLNIAKGFKPNPRFHQVVLNHRKNLQSSTITQDSSLKLVRNN